MAEAKGGKKASLPEVMDQACYGPAERDQIIHDLEVAADLKIEIEQQTEKLDEVKEALSAITAEQGLEGLRHGKIAFLLRLQPGRVSVDMEKFKQQLLMQGVQVAVIKAALDAATKQGESYWVREISLLK